MRGELYAILHDKDIKCVNCFVLSVESLTFAVKL